MSSITQILELSVFAKGHKQNKNQNSTSSWIKKKKYQTQMADKSNIAIISVSQADIIPSISKTAA